MKTYRTQFLITLVVILGNYVNGFAQDTKIAVVDANYIMASIAQAQTPEYVSAQENVQLYGQKLQEDLQIKIQTLQQEAGELEASIGTMTEEAANQAVQEFRQRELELQQEQQNAQNKLAQKEAEELEPIYKMIEEAIIGIVSEQGYSHVLRKEALLYEPPNADISNEVLNRMGVSPASNE